MSETTSHDLAKARRNGATLELARLGITIQDGSGVTTEEMENMLSVLADSTTRPEIPLLVQRARNRAVGAAIDAAACARIGRYSDARDLLAEAAGHLDTAEQREEQQR